MGSADRRAQIEITANGEAAQREIEKLETQAKNLKNSYDSMLSSGNVNSPEAIQTLANLQKELKSVESQIRRTEAANIDYEKALSVLSGTAENQLRKMQSSLRNTLKTMSEESTDRRKYEEYFEAIQAQINKLSKGYTQAGKAAEKADELSMKAKREVLKQLHTEQDLVKGNSAAWTTYQQKIEKVEQAIEKAASASKRMKAEQIAANPNAYTRTEAKNAVIDLEGKKQDLKVGDQAGYTALQDKIDRINNALTTTSARLINVSSVMGRLDSAPAEELRAAIEQINGELQRNNATLNPQVVKHMQDNVALLTTALAKAEGKYVDIVSVIHNVDKASEAQISQAIKQLEEEKKALDRTAPEYKQKIDQINLLRDALKGSKQETVSWQDVMNNLDISNTTEINTAIQQLEKLRSEQILGSNEWKDYGDKINSAKDYLAQFNEQSKKMSLTQAESISSNPNAATRGEAKEAISVLNTQKESLSVGDAQAMKQVEDQIKSINDALNYTEKQYIRIGDIIKNPANFNPEQIKSGIKQVQESLDKMAMGNPNRSQREQQLENLNNLLKKVKENTVDVDKVFANLKTSSLDDLKNAASKLEKEISSLSPGVKKFAEKTKELKSIKKQIEEVTDAWKTHDGMLLSVAKRLTAYIGVYGAFNQATQLIQDAIRGNLQLSDSMADVRKTTSLTAKDMAELSKNIDSIDTRTSQEELHKLAYEAGKLGITGKENLMEFVKAGNEVVVALGEDLGGSEAIKNLMKINDVLGETKKLGIEKSLLATGSAINEVGQSSTASEGYIADFAQRMAGVAAQSHLTMAELIALGGTTDALGQNVEVAATTLNKVFVTLQTHTEDVARAAGVSKNALKDLLDQGQSMEAFQMVIAGLSKKKGGLGELAPLFKDMGSDGARMVAVMSSMVSGHEMLTQQLATSNKAYREATSITHEYNVKNESAMAILQRLGNNIREVFVNSAFVGALKNILVMLADIPNFIDRHYGAIITIRSAIIALNIVLFANSQLWLTIKGGFFTFMGTIWMYIKAVFVAVTTTNGWVTSFNKLKAALASNWLTLVVAAIVAIGTAVYSMSTKVDAATEAMGGFISEITKETLALNSLKTAISQTVEKSAQRSELIAELNNRYGKYLGFMLTETNYAKNQAWAYDMINTKLRETIALKMKEKMTDNIMTKYSEPLQDATEDMYKYISFLLGDKKADKLMPQIASLVQNYIGQDEDRIYKYVTDLLARNDISPFLTKGTNFPSLNDYISTQKKIHNEMGHASSMFEGQAKSSKAHEANLVKNKTQEMDKTILKSEDVTELKNYMSVSEKYIATLKKNSAEYKHYVENRLAVSKKLTALVPDANVPEFSGDPLNAKDRKKLTAAQLKAENERKRKEREELTAEKKRISEFEANLEKQMNKDKSVEKEDFLKGTQTEVEMQHNLLTIERGYYLARAAGLQGFLNEKKTIIDKHGKAIEINAIKDKSLRAKMGNDIAESQNKEISLRLAHQKKIEEILLENDPIKKVHTDYKIQLQELGLFNASTEKLTKAQADKRLEVFAQYARMSDNMNVADFKVKIGKEKEFELLRANMTEQDYQVLLSQLQKFHEEEEDAITKQKNKIKKIAKRVFEQSDEKKQVDSIMSDNDTAQKENDEKTEYGIDKGFFGNEGSNKDLALSKQRIAGIKAEMALIEEKKTLGEKCTEREIELKSQLALEEKKYTGLFMKEMTKRGEQLSQYTEIFGSAASKWLAAQFQSDAKRKQSSKEAANQLLRDSLTLTVKLLADWGKRAAFSIMFDKVKTTSHVASEGEKTKTEAKGTFASLILNAFKAQGKEIGSKGLLGLVTGAALFALVMGMQALAMSAVNSSFPEAGVSGGADAKPAEEPKRLAAGMLTYAEGRYPVLGNDGKKYDANYEPELKTGIYKNASFGIFSEKEPEMVVSGPTTKKLMLNYPEIMKAIHTIDKGGSLKTYANGKMPSIPVGGSSNMDPSALAHAIATILAPVMQENAAATSALTEQLSKGIEAKINKYGRNGLIEQVNEGQEFYRKNKING